MATLPPDLCREVLDGLPVALAVVDPSLPGWPVVYANPAFARLFGASAESVTALNWCDLAEPRGGAGQGDAALLKRPACGFWSLRQGTAVFNASTRPLPRVGAAPLLQLTLGDAVLQERPQPALAALQRAALAQRLDPATGLPLRAPLLEMLQRDWGRARRDGRRVSLILFRIDGLDSYRGLFGQHAAESCLKRVGQLIAGCLRRAGDYCARYDEDCFAALIDNQQELELRALAARIASRVRSLGIHHPRLAARFITVSAGIASEIPGRDAAGPGLLEMAERSLDEQRPEMLDTSAIVLAGTGTEGQPAQSSSPSTAGRTRASMPNRG
ncbi:MAG: sensor domain-containing diguanylate cyclase [Chromatiales bacterium]|nr:sensor domain-containing diguanylate cyclase [Chromatiales bacterium]